MTILAWWKIHSTRESVVVTILFLFSFSPRSIRLAAAEQFLMISTWCSAGQQPLQFCVSLLFSVLNNMVLENARNSHEYFQLLCRMVNYAFISGCPIADAELLLNNEITWLKKIRVSYLLCIGTPIFADAWQILRKKFFKINSPESENTTDILSHLQKLL